MAGASGCIPDFQVNVFGQLCRPARRRPSATAGTSSGCIPDFEVNFFGQLCGPAARLPSSSPSSIPPPEHPEPDSDSDTQSQANNGKTIATSTRTMHHVPTPDLISELFQKNQILIRSLARGDVETDIAAVRSVFEEVRRSREEHVRRDHMGRRAVVAAGQTQEYLKQETETSLQRGETYPRGNACLCVEDSTAEAQEIEIRLRRRGEQCRFLAGCRCVERERDEENHRIGCGSQSRRGLLTTHLFTIKHYEQDEDEEGAMVFGRERAKLEGGMVCSRAMM